MVAKLQAIQQNSTQENGYYQPIQINSKKRADILGKIYNKNSPTTWFGTTCIIKKLKGLSELSTIYYPVYHRLHWILLPYLTCVYTLLHC